MAFAPVSDRLATLDVLRGVAIIGMFAVNMSADIFWSDSFAELAPASADFVSLALVYIFANGKFISIFSFLFGIGFYVQVERRVAAGLSVSAFWLKRMSGLLLIGLVANALTIPAWILIDYALFGLCLLLFYRMQPGRLLAVAAALFVVERFFDVGFPGFLPPGEAGIPVLSQVGHAIHDLESLLRQNGGFFEIAATALVHLWAEFTWWPYYFIDLDIFILMLLGLYVARVGAVRDENVRLALARKTLGWLLGIGLVSAVAWLLMTKLGFGEDPASFANVARKIIIWPFATSFVGLGYAALIALLMRTDKWRPRLAVFAPVGRMVLTNYLFTGFVLAFLSYQWGLGLYGDIYPFAGLLIVAACVPLQVLASRWWLANFEYGPLEWLWRRWTYGHPLAMRPASQPA